MSVLQYTGDGRCPMAYPGGGLFMAYNGMVMEIDGVNDDVELIGSAGNWTSIGGAEGQTWKLRYGLDANAYPFDDTGAALGAIVLNSRVSVTSACARRLLNNGNWVRYFTITASAGAHGTVTPSGDTNVDSAGSQAYTITPATNYAVADVLVDGVSHGQVTSYTFTNLSADHTISATFSLI